ncbi:MAG: ABC transporter ATP-binding protein [Pseudomonadota bacterium]
MTDSAPRVHIEKLEFAWPKSPRLLEIEEFDLRPGERLFLRGPSGSGKSTLLGLIAGVLTPQTGKISVCGYDMSKLNGTKRDQIRADRLGVIFQMFNLVPYLTVAQNVALPCRFSKRRAQQVAQTGNAATEVERLLSRLGLDDPSLIHRPVTALSVGQQQRVAAARALIGGPEIVIADEPTSALDADSRDRFISLLTEEASRSGASLLFVSHDSALSSHFDRAIDLNDLNRAHHNKAAA